MSRGGSRAVHCSGPGRSAMAGPQQRMLLRGVVASHAMPAIVRHPARKGPTPVTGCRVHGAVCGGPLTAGYYLLDRWAACSRMRRRVHRRRPF
jgi:hypothetical protein